MIEFRMPSKRQQLALISTEARLSQLDIKEWMNQRACPIFRQWRKTRKFQKAHNMTLEGFYKLLRLIKQVQIVNVNMQV